MHFTVHSVSLQCFKKVAVNYLLMSTLKTKSLLSVTSVTNFKVFSEFDTSFQ